MPTIPSEFKNYLTIAHLAHLRNTTSKKKGLEYFCAKQAISLLRYTKDIPVDITYYEAGKSAKAAGMNNMAFVCWNRFLDICEAIEEQDASLLENSDFENTDIPLNVDLPRKSMPDAVREDVRDWVLQVSLDQQIHQDFDKRLCEGCGVDVYDGGLSCYKCGETSEACIVTGYPILRASRVQCGGCGKGANKEDWNKYLGLEGSCPWCQTNH